MKSKLLSAEKSRRSFVLIFETDEEVKESLLAFCRENQLSSAELSGIGGFSEVKLGLYDFRSKDYKPFTLHEQLELLSFLGNLTLNNGQPFLHAHAVVAKADGSAFGGHFLGGKVRPTLELFIRELPHPLPRKYDEPSGLALIEPD